MENKEEWGINDDVDGMNDDVDGAHGDRYDAISREYLRAVAGAES